jgi:hypothetical protein
MHRGLIVMGTRAVLSTVLLGRIFTIGLLGVLLLLTVLPNYLVLSESAGITSEPTEVRVGILLNYPTEHECHDRQLVTQHLHRLMASNPLNVDVKLTFLSSLPVCETAVTSMDVVTVFSIPALYNAQVLDTLNGYGPDRLLVEAFFQSDDAHTGMGRAMRGLQDCDLITIITGLASPENVSYALDDTHCANRTDASDMLALPARLKLVEHLIQLIPLHARPILLPLNFAFPILELCAPAQTTDVKITPLWETFLMEDVAKAVSENFAVSSEVMIDQEIPDSSLKLLQHRFEQNKRVLRRFTDPGVAASSTGARSLLNVPSAFTGRFALALAKSVHTKRQSVEDTDGDEDSKVEKGAEDEVDAYLKGCDLDESDQLVLSSVRAGLSQPSSEPHHPSRSRVLCMTYTMTANHHRVKSIVRTWAQQCDGYLAFSNETDTRLNILQLLPQSCTGGKPSADTCEVHARPESYNEMWYKTQLIWTFVYSAQEIFNEFDYFLLGGDDLYVVVENLRDLLGSEEVRNYIDVNERILFGTKETHKNILGQGAKGHGTRVPLYVGRLLHANAYVRFNSGGSGYVLNRAAVSILVNALNSKSPMNNKSLLSQSSISREGGFVALPPSTSSIDDSEIDDDKVNAEFGHFVCLPTASTSMEDLFVGHCLNQAGVEPFPYSSLFTASPLNPPVRLSKDRELGAGKMRGRLVSRPARLSGDEDSDMTNERQIDQINLKLATLFHPVSPSQAVQPHITDSLEWYVRMTHSYADGTQCCGNNSISFQNIKEPKYSMECIDARVRP